ncbi:hypothetical protein Lesp02_12060 [Lentzea sp. NBRC 105346]|uniref:isocitrate lyase/PEP mutase family protein n=1 Tax=Lentzea sp. NBRC 105346 TaxID=3032205 RepID=UPI0024A45238|nr:isocitrate lyase/phosphoenolpyruvate mutase family protein [Lentzea sp. NBRC 105346]GLZ29016.1 hypothetical protein Lesp02_12060 [Lentzea sp. NBRC 105346]
MTDVLNDYVVPPVPAGSSGVAWLRANVARFSEGADHVRRRALAVEILESLDVRPGGRPVVALAAAMGLPFDGIDAIARSYQPHLPITPEADAAVERLVALCGARDERAAARIGLLVQACDATDALVDKYLSGSVKAPVPVTRRVAPDGSVVEVDLSGTPFGSGRHACPGRSTALALAAGAVSFHDLHRGFLLLPNAWDHASAAALVDAGFPAIGTTSLGVAASFGIPDGAGLTRPETVELARRLRHLPCHVSVDIEMGFSDSPAAVGDLVAGLGVAGVNLEDGVEDPRERAEFVRAVKERAPDVFLNARIDTYWLHKDTSSTLDRALRYLDAGADGIFVPGLRDIGSFTERVDAPVNVLYTGEHTLPQLRDLGVRRVSTGSLLFRTAVKTAIDTALRLDAGNAFSVAEVQRWSD